MYLETRIERLEAKIDELIKLLSAPPTTAPNPVMEKAPTQNLVVETVRHTPANIKNTPITKEKLQSFALEQVRNDKSFKLKLIEQLGKYNVKTITQLPDDAAAQDVYDVLGGGK